MNDNSLGLVIGNSRLHWAWFEHKILQETWDTPHLTEEIDSVKSLSKILPQKYQLIAKYPITIYLASVVATQTVLWRNYPQIQPITLLDVPLLNTYNSLGIDRALSIYGAGETYNYPCLVVDSGTALTFTGVDRQKKLVGGAILPGLRSQFIALHQQTAALPPVSIPLSLPPRWALDTEKAISSGITYTITAGIYSYINDWLKEFSNSSVIITGGDRKLIFHYLKSLYPQIIKFIIVDKNLIFQGMRSLYFL